MGFLRDFLRLPLRLSTTPRAPSPTEVDTSVASGSVPSSSRAAAVIARAITCSEASSTAPAPSKLAALTVVSSELAADSDPAATTAITDGLSRDIAQKIDAAFFGDLPAPAQAGLGALTGFTEVDAGTAWSDLDPFAEAMSAVDVLGTTVDSFIGNPADVLALAKVKDETESNRPLLGVDATQAGRRQISGTPLYPSPYVPAGTVWAAPRSRSFVVTRQGVDAVISSDAYFSSDRIAIRALTRIGFGFPQPAALVKIALSS